MELNKHNVLLYGSPFLSNEGNAIHEWYLSRNDRVGPKTDPAQTGLIETDLPTVQPTLEFKTTDPIMRPWIASLAINSWAHKNTLLLQSAPKTFVTMADAPPNNNEQDPPQEQVPPVVDAAVVPPLIGSADVLGLPGNVEIEEMMIPYSGGGSLGIMLQREGTEMRDVYTLPNGDCAPFNEPLNTYGLKVLALVMIDMRERRDTLPQDDTPRRAPARIGEVASFDRVIRRETTYLTDRRGYPEEPLTTRHVNMMWSIMKDFAAGPANNHLDEVTCIYAEIRLGSEKKDVDEFGAAVAAFQQHYLNTTPDNQTVGKGIWTIALVHMLDGHLRHRGLTPISFASEMDRDEALRTGARMAHSTVQWDDKTPYKVENRPTVIQELGNYCEQIHGLTLLPIPDCDGDPANRDDDDSDDEDDGGDGGGRKRPRCDFVLG